MQFINFSVTHGFFLNFFLQEEAVAMNQTLEKQLTKMTLSSLVEVQTFVQGLVTTKKAEEKDTLLEEFKTKADLMGFSWSEIVGDQSANDGKKGKRASPKPKYRNPSDSNDTWTGRGRAPKWMQAALEAGKKKEDFLIDPPTEDG